MFFHQDSNIEELFIHRVGNKANDEFYILSDNSIDLSTDELLPDLLMQYYMKSFSKSVEVYRFHHENDFALNEVFNFLTQFFEGIITLQELSNHLAIHLYNTSDHPKIKAGELHVVHFKNVQMEGEEHDAIGIFKTEVKHPVLKINPSQSGFKLDRFEDTVSIDKLDKGVIIVNTEAEEGYKVLITDNSSITESVYWKDDFLKVIARNDNYQKTTNFLKFYKHFVDEKLDDVFELEPTDKADLLRRSMSYFKSKETFDQQEFEEDVFGDERVSSLFTEYKKEFEEELETPIDYNFEIASNAVKKMQTSYKSVIKLDKNFQIAVNGSSKLIDKGYDEEKGMNYYKLYFENEN